MPSFKLASQSLNTGKSSGQLNPTLLSGNAASGLRTARVSTGAGDVKFTPSPVPKVMSDPTLEATLRFGDALLQGVSKFNERQDQVLADEAVLQNRERMRKSFYGYLDNNGEFVKGYKSTVGIDANDGFSSHTQGLKEGYQSQLEGLAPNVKRKAMLRMQNDYNNAMNNAATHNSRQLEVSEGQALYAEGKDIRSTIEVSGAAAFTDGTVDQWRAKFDTAEEADAETAKMAKYLVHTQYNQSMRENNDPNQAYKNTEAEFAKIRDTLSPLARNEMDYHLLQQKKKAETHAKKTYNARQSAHQKNMNANAPSMNAQNMVDGNYALIGANATSIRGAYRSADGSFDGVKASKAVVGSVTGAIDMIAADPSLVTVESKMAEVNKHMESVLAPENASKFLVHELGAIQAYMSSGAPGSPSLESKLIAQQKRVDERAKWQNASEIASAAKGEIPFSRISSHQGASAQAREEMEDQIKMAQMKIADGVAVEESVAQEGAEDTFKGYLKLGPLSGEQKKDLEYLYKEGIVGPQLYAAITEEHRRVSRKDFVKPKYKQTQAYKAGNKSISSLAKMGVFNAGDEPSDSGSNQKKVQAHAKWAAETAANEQRMVLEMNGAVEAAFKRGDTNFSITDWTAKYIKDNFYGGKDVSPSYLKKLFGSVPAVVGKGVESVTTRGALFVPSTHMLTGNDPETIMDNP